MTPLRLAFLALLTGATGIGFAPILVRLSETGPSATALFRLLFALPLIWIWMLWERRTGTPPQPRTPRQFGALAFQPSSSPITSWPSVLGRSYWHSDHCKSG